MASIEEMRGNLQAAKRKWEEEKSALGDARERVMDALTLTATLGNANREATEATRVAFAFKGSMGQGGEFALRLADQMRARISSQATALRVVVAELDKLAPNIDAQLNTIDQMLTVLGS